MKCKVSVEIPGGVIDGLLIKARRRGTSFDDEVVTALTKACPKRSNRQERSYLEAHFIQVGREGRLGPEIQKVLSPEHWPAPARRTSMVGRLLTWYKKRRRTV